MGINGLLKALAPLLIPENECQPNVNQNQHQEARNTKTPTAKHNIRQFANKTLAIDASSWLFKASYSCAEGLVEAIESNEIDKKSEYMLCNYMTKRCEELLNHASIKRVYLVFDGKRCPLKEVTNKEREAKRNANLKEARRLKAIGRNDLAGDKYRACVKVTHWMAESVARAVKKKWGDGNNNHFVPPKVQCIFSPYEADAQLVKLCMDQLADAVVTEDSDVLVYSAACNISFPIIYKLSRDDGSCDVFTMDWLLASTLNNDNNDTKKTWYSQSDNHHLGYPSMRRQLISTTTANNRNSSNSSNLSKNKKTKSQSKKSGGQGAALLSHLIALLSRENRIHGSGSRMFVQACVLAGCDYAPSRLVGVGLVTAFKLVKDNAHRDVHARFHYILKSVPHDKIIGGGEDMNDSKKENNSTISTSTIRSCRDRDPSVVVQTYEELLAKSEAVFYYHLVRDIESGETVSLVQPPAETGEQIIDSKTDDGVEHAFRPSISRFGSDISFVGVKNTTKDSTESVVVPQVSMPLSQPSTNSSFTVPKNPYIRRRQNESLFHSYTQRNESKKQQQQECQQNTIQTCFKAVESKNCEKKQKIPSSDKKKNLSPQRLFSQFARNTLVSTVTNTDNKKTTSDPLIPITRQSSYSISSQQKCDTLDSDGDDDELDDDLFSGGLNKGDEYSIITPKQRKPNQKDIILDASDSATKSSMSFCDISERASSVINSHETSKYFTFETDNSKPDSSCYKTKSLTARFVTPKSNTNEKRESIEYNLNRNTSNKTEIRSSSIDSEDSNECVIIEDPTELSSRRSLSTSNSSSFLTNNSQSIFERFQRQKIPSKSNDIKMIRDRSSQSKFERIQSQQDSSQSDDINMVRERNSQSIFERFQSQQNSSQSDDNNMKRTRNSIMPCRSSFSKAQREGTRAKFASPNPDKRRSSTTTTAKKRKLNTTTFTSSEIKRGRTQSINGFFRPLNTK